MLEDRPRNEDDLAPDATPPVQPFNFVYVLGVAFVALIAAAMSAFGLLWPALIFLGAFAAFVLIQALVFKIFRPAK
jgi:hypothetical protein